MRHTSADKLSSGSADGLRSLRYSTNKIPSPLEMFYLRIFYPHCLLFYFPIFKKTHSSVKFYLMLSIFTFILRQVRFIADIHSGVLPNLTNIRYGQIMKVFEQFNSASPFSSLTTSYHPDRQRGWSRGLWKSKRRL